MSYTSSVVALFQRHPEPILSPMPEVSWASGAVFNPGAWYDGAQVHLLFRGVPAGYRRVPLEQTRPGEPAWGFEPYVSYIGYAHSSDGVHFTVRPEPFIHPDAPYDRFGVEDPRISRIDDLYLITYTALGAPAFATPGCVRIGLASSPDFRTVTKHGIVGPEMTDKDAVIFPKRIRGRIAMLHRIAPSIQLIYFEDLEQLFHPPAALWERHLRTLDEHVILRPEFPWEAKKIGAGPTPIETPEGWLLLYHGVDMQYVYRMGMALLDLEDPKRVIARTPEPVLAPELPFEREGDVPNVVFPEGAVVINDMLYVYYGAADRTVGLARASLSDVLTYLRTCPAEVSS
ncbi:glycoside hydrolase family 130 protein [Rhodothermus bifroesti]|uniref:Glycosidase n=1 Tax=Rhodothermus marinus TaxID=29549 RepID=A0A7V2F6E0_RHOMR|nr:glycosidase [Rhodothermus bifroesti]GBD02094.1 1,4-beta-mannosyl-N-acetylglucosamine phosphorylase [bacterium HR18]